MKVPRRSLFALVVGFFFPGFRSDPDPASPLSVLRLTKKPTKCDPRPWIEYQVEYICPVHGDIGPDVMHYAAGVSRLESTPPLNDVFCCYCIFNQLKKLPIARLGE